MNIFQTVKKHQMTSISKRTTQIICFIIIVLAVIFAGCGDEENPVNPDPSETEWAGLPEITSVNFTPPDTTASLVASVSDLSHFEPYISQGNQFCDIFNYQNPVNCNFTLLYPDTMILLELKIVPDYYLLIASGQKIEPNLQLQLKDAGSPSADDLVREYSEIPYRYAGKFGDHYYYLSREVKNGAEALFNELANARWFGGDYLNIGSTEENDFVTSVMNQEIPGEHLWLGLSDFYEDGSWFWINGDNHAYSDWSSSEPDGGSSEQVTVKASSGGGWADVNYSEVFRLYHSMVESTDSLCCWPDSSWRYVLPGSSIDIHFYPSQDLVVDEAPKIRHVRYYRLMADGGLDAGGSYSNAYTLRYGVDTTVAASATKTIKGTVGATWEAISASLSAELSETFSTTITIRRFTEESKTLTCDGPSSGTQRKFIFWQKCERFELVDSEGNLWSDPNYEINPVLLDHPLNSYIIQTRDF